MHTNSFHTTLLQLYTKFHVQICYNYNKKKENVLAVFFKI
jgi:hypothetical protein